MVIESTMENTALAKKGVKKGLWRWRRSGEVFGVKNGLKSIVKYSREV